MIRKPHFKFNWKYALGEIFLIFVGISLAIAFDNWNEDRKRDQLEIDVLLQIKNELEFNQGDITADYIKMIWGLESLVYIDSVIAENRPYKPEMAFDFYWIQFDEYTLPGRGGYDKLKSLGLDLIKNDSIREFVQFAYEYAYPRISKETTFYPDLNEFFAPYYQAHFSVNQDENLVFDRDYLDFTIRYPYTSNVGGISHQMHIGFVPNDFKALKKDKAFGVMLRQSKDYRRFKIEEYKTVIDVSNWLLDRIDKELNP